MNYPLLKIENLTLGFEIEGKNLKVTDGLSLHLNKGEGLALVGESGCGKTATAMAILQLLPSPKGKVLEGQIFYKEQDILQMSPQKLVRIRGGDIGFVFQEPLTALNPVMTVGKQIIESIRLHRGFDKSSATMAACDLLEEVGITDPTVRLKAYPHELSGGLRQRVNIALALSGNPNILIADEPTSALDVALKSQILELLQDLKKNRGLTLLFITHELGLVSHLCENIAVMYAGQIVELAPANDLLERACHPYTRALLASYPSLKQPTIPLLNSIVGSVPPIGQWPIGCRFANRCFFAQECCQKPQPWEGTIQKGIRCCRSKELFSS